MHWWEVLCQQNVTWRPFFPFCVVYNIKSKGCHNGPLTANSRQTWVPARYATVQMTNGRLRVTVRRILWSPWWQGLLGGSCASTISFLLNVDLFWYRN